MVGAALPLALLKLPPTLALAVLPGVLVLAGLVVLAFARPEPMVVAAFALLSVVRIEPGPTDLLFGLLIGATALRMPRPMRVPAPILGLVAGYGLLTLASMINAVDFIGAAKFGMITIYLLVLPVWLTGMLDEATLCRRAIKAYVLTAIAASLIGIAAVKVPGFPLKGTLTFGGERAQGFFKDPNVYGPFMVPAAAIVLEELGRPRLLGWRTRTTFLALCVLVAGNIYAFSRAGWLNLAVAFFVIGAVYALRRRGLGASLRITLAVLLCGGAGFGLLAATGSLGFLEQRGHVTQSYDATRFATQSEELGRATVHVLGYGPGQSEATLGHSTHSLYVRVVYEQGPLGLALLGSIVVGTLLAAIGLAYRDADVYGIGSAALLGAWLGTSLNGFFVDTSHWRHMWMLAALIWLGTARERARTSPSSSL